MNRKIIFIWILEVLMLFVSGRLTPGYTLPFSAGEKITYDLHIAGARIGSMETIFLGSDTYQGHDCYKWVSRSKYRNVVDQEIFHATRDRFLPLLVQRYIQKGKKLRVVNEFYNQDKNILEIREKNGKKKILKYNTPIHNMVLLPYFLRLQKLAPGENFKVYLPKVSFDLRIKKKEKIKIPAGVFDAYLLKSTPGYTKIWMSVSEPRIPLRIDVRFFMFRMSMRLKKIEPAPGLH